MVREVSGGGAVGVLVRYTDGFRVHLIELGYARSSVSGQLLLVAELNDWLAEEGLDLTALTAEVVVRFVRARRGRSVYVSGPRVLDPLLGYLRGLGVVADAAVSADTPVEGLLAVTASTWRASAGWWPGRSSGTSMSRDRFSPSPRGAGSATASEARW